MDIKHYTDLYVQAQELTDVLQESLAREVAKEDCNQDKVTHLGRVVQDLKLQLDACRAFISLMTHTLTEAKEKGRLPEETYEDIMTLITNHVDLD